MIDALLEPLAQGIGQRAALELMLAGLACGPLGVWVLLHRQSYAAESLAHAMLPGLALAAVAGLPLGLGAALGLAAAAGAIRLVLGLRRLEPDIAVAVVVTAMVGLGTLLALAPATPTRLSELLFGDPLSVDTADLAATGAGALVLLGALGALHRPLLVSAFDPQSWPRVGARGGGLALLALLALAILVAVQGLGNLLVVALLVAPGAAALRLCSRVVPALALAAGLAVVAGLAGLYVSHYLELAAGASVALASLALVPLAALLSHARSRARRGRAMRQA